MPKMIRIAPEVQVTDLRRTLEHYEKKLGFRVAMRMPAGDYAIVERDSVAIHLYQDDAKPFSAASMHVFTQGLDELHAELRQRGAEVTQEIVLQPWGNRDFRVRDSSGNTIKFTEPS